MHATVADDIQHTATNHCVCVCCPTFCPGCGSIRNRTLPACMTCNNAYCNTALLCFTPILFQAVTSDGNVLAVGGEGCQLSLWDLGAQSRAWQAKGAKPNSIGLVDLAYVTAATFVSNYTKRKTDSTGGEGGCSVGRRIVVVGNTSHKLLLYDTSAGRRPQLEVAWRDARITALEADDAGGQSIRLGLLRDLATRLKTSPNLGHMRCMCACMLFTSIQVAHV